MASVVLPIVASAATKGASAWVVTAATVVASAAGSYIDSQVLMPAIFPTDRLKTPGGKLEELDLQSASEGSPVKRLYGPEVRTKGTIIWVSEWRSWKGYPEDYGMGGKGGGENDPEEPETQLYAVDIAIAISGRPITGLLRVQADDKKLMAVTETRTVGPSTQLSIVPRERHDVPKWYRKRHGNDAAWNEKAPVMRIESPVGGPDLSQFAPRQAVQISGCATPANNGTYTVLKRKEKGDGRTLIEVLNPDAVTESAGSAITIVQYVAEIGNRRCTAVNFYDGTQVTADSTIETAEGTSVTPAFRGISYIVIEDLLLNPYGRRIPQFSIFAKADTSITDGEIIAEELIEAGLTADQVDASACDAEVTGFIVSGPQNKLSALSPLFTAYDRIGQEIGGQLIFKPREDADEIEVPEADLGAREVGADVPVLMQIEDVATLALPTEVNVAYIDATDDENLGSTRMRKLDGPADGKGGVMNVNLPLVLTPSEARSIAARLLWVPHTHRRNARIQLPPSYIHVTENDVLSVTANGRTVKILVRKVDRGALSAMHIVEGPIYRADAFEQDVTGGTKVTNGDTSLDLYFPSDVIFRLVDIAPFLSAHVEKLGYYWGCCAADRDAQWAGAIVYISADAGDHYTFLAPASYEATIGDATTELASGPVGVWDRENTVTVELDHGELYSRTEREVLDGMNVAVLGGEVIAFQNATLVDDDKYELSTLLRGLRNSEDYVDDHAVGEGFLLMNVAGVHFQEMGSSAIGKLRLFKAAATGVDVDDVDEDEYGLLGMTLVPFSPARIEGTRDGSDNLTVTWVPRSREPMDEFSMLPLPAMGPSESYEIDFLDGSTVVRTKTATSRTVEYTAAEQTTDGLTPGDPVDLVVYQMSAVVGRGNPGEATV